MDDIKILVDRGPSVLESVLAQRIRAWGYRVHIVQGPTSALDPSVALVVCAHDTLGAWLKAVGPEAVQRVPFLALVPGDSKAAGRAALTAGAFEVLSWPCPDSSLGLTLTRALRWHALVAERFSGRSARTTQR